MMDHTAPSPLNRDPQEVRGDGGTNGILDVIISRRAVRRFTDRSISDEVINRVVEAARWAPSASNRQPCVFIVVDSPELIERLRACSPGIIGHPTAIVCVAVDTSRSPVGQAHSESVDSMDAAMAAQNLMLEAASLGVGSCPVLSFSQAGVSAILCLPPHVVPKLLVSLGYASGPITAPPRRPINEVSHRNVYRDTVVEEKDGEKASSDTSMGSGFIASKQKDSTSAGDKISSSVSGEPPVGLTGPNLSQEILRVIGFILASAQRLLLGEPAFYGPLRLVDVAERLAGALVKCGYDQRVIGALLRDLESAKQSLGGGSTDDFLSLMENAVILSLREDT